MSPHRRFQSLLHAVSRVRFENGKTPAIVRQFLIDQLRYNDNTSNAVSIMCLPSQAYANSVQFSDALYICSIISALACATVSTVPPERGEFVTAEARPPMDPEDEKLLKEAVSEVDRYRSMDRLIPSVHNVVSIATIEVSQLLSLRHALTHIHQQFYLLLSVANLIPHDTRMLIPLTRYDKTLDLVSYD